MKFIKQVEVKLKDLAQSELYKQIGNGHPYNDKITKIEGNIRTQGFKFQNGGIPVDKDLTYFTSRHGILAAINVLGKDHRIHVDVYESSPAEWMERFVNDNAISEGLSWSDKIDAVTMAHKWLKKHDESCKYHSSQPGTNEKSAREDGRGGRLHEHGSVECIVYFLNGGIVENGEAKWSSSTVHRLMKDADLDIEVRKETTYRDSSHKPQKGVLTIPAASALNKLEKPVQKAVVQAIKHEKDVAISVPLIKQAVQVIKEQEPKKQEQAAKAAIQAAAETQRREEQLRKAKDANSVAQRIINDIVTMEMPFDEDDLKQILGSRDLISSRIVQGLIEALRRAAKKFDHYADEFEKPVPKKLTQGR